MDNMEHEMDIVMVGFLRGVFVERRYTGIKTQEVLGLSIRDSVSLVRKPCLGHLASTKASLSGPA